MTESIRVLSPSERIYVDFSAGSSVLGSLLLQGDFSLPVATAVCEALAKRHPLLRAVVSRDEEQAVFCFPEGAFSLDIQQQSVQASELSECYQRTQNVMLNPAESLFKVAVFQATDIEQTLVIFLVHHSISDGASVSALLREFLEGVQALAEGRAFEPDTYTVPESVDDLCPMPVVSADDIRRADQAMVDKLTPVMMPYKPELPLDTPPSMHTLTRSLSGTEADQLKALCQQHGVTLHGALSAALIMAARDFALSVYQRDELQLTIKYALDVRRRLPTPLPVDHMCTAVTAYNEIYHLYQGQDFWNIARETNDRIQNYLKDDGAARSVHVFKSRLPLQKANVSLMISNIGPSGLLPAYGALKVLDAHVHATVFAPCPVVTILTVNGQINIDFSFTQPFVPEYAAIKIADSTLAFLHHQLGLPDQR